MILLKRRAFMTYKFKTVSGIRQLVLTKCMKAPFKQFGVLGNSRQNSTTGKNLFNLTDNYLHAYFYAGGNREIVPYNSNAVVYLPCEPNTTYTIHGRKNINNDMTRKNRVGLTSEFPAFNVKLTKTAETTLDKPVTITTEEDTKYLVIMAITDGEIGRLNFDEVLENNTSKLMVEVGDKASPYEPYTGGKPSPSPDYPQEIKSVGKWNEETQKYEVDVKITGKNLFDKRLLEGGNFVEFGGVECYKYTDGASNFKYHGNFESGQQYAFTTRMFRDASNESLNTDIQLCYTDGSKSQITLSHGKSQTVISDKKKTIEYIYGNYNYTKPVYLDLSVTRLNAGTKDVGYEPYKEQSLTLTSDRPITKWDKLVEQDGQIGWLYQSARKTFENDTFKLYGENEKAIQYQIPFEDIIGNWNEEVCYCNTFESVSGYSIYTQSGEEDFYMGCSKKYMVFSAKNKNGVFQSVEVFQEWIRNSSTYVWHKINTPQFVPLPQSEQDAVRNLKTYYPTTVIMVDGGDVDAGIEVEYAVKNKEKI